MMKLFTFAICTLLFLVCLHVVDAGVETVSTSVELIASDTCVVDIIVDNPSNNNLELFISTEILPDGEGITITYHPTSPFVLDKKSAITVKMTIDTDFALLPQQYIIRTSFFYSSNSDDDHYYTPVDYSYIPTDNDVADNDTTNNGTTPDNDINETDDNVLIASVIVGGNSKYVWLVYPAIIAVVIISLLFYFRKKKEYESKNERHK